MTDTAVLLPGTGSDDVFIRSVFAAPLAAAGVTLVAPEPVPGPDLGLRHLLALDSAYASHGPVLAGGISFGAHLAAEWACAHPSRCAGLLLAMPAWHGAPGDCPAAVAARFSAGAVRRDGLDATLAAADVSPWLAAELDRAWRRHGPGLVDSLLAAADRPAPALAQLASLDIPVGVVAVHDDPLHPATVAAQWTATIPGAELRSLSFADFGADRSALGRAAVAAWQASVVRRGSPPAA
ncbi:alpha/beta fold hydrolase [Kutzneria kofuensis]|uniref:Pimeloyl-ACP methyl ester carboxylesterase n=1 Tax=Kutzneria kofuensis TaxID=103725 RepID=A0A7W9KL25_9PSEU|nr:alpha/beta hydrolase [Kutzneria kofuensis]MBB5894553.1 pimeloyl-ACP methyl ester carboxylesterase [Kutzneria kofuensis]